MKCFYCGKRLPETPGGHVVWVESNSPTKELNPTCLSCLKEYRLMPREIRREHGK